MTRKMKGFTSAILAILLTMVLLYAIAISLDFSFQSGFTINRKVDLQQDLYAMGNALDAAKLYMETALKFSIYQALYDYGKEGKQDSTTAKLTNDIREKIKANLNKYASSQYTFLSQNYKVSIPEYESVEVNGDYPDLQIIAVPNGNAIINRADPEEKVRLEKIMKMETYFNYPIIRIIDALSPEKIKENAILQMSKNWKTSAEKTIVGCENRYLEATPLEIFNSAHGTNFQSIGDAQDQVKASVESGIVDITNLEANPGIKVSQNFTAQKTSITLECKPVQVDNKCDNQEKTFYKKIQCDFQYVYSGIINFFMQDSEVQYPVKIQEEDKEKIQFKQPDFYTGNTVLIEYKKN